MEFDLKPPSKKDLIEQITGYKGKIYFGVPIETTIRHTGKVDRIDNATILAIMEHGSPVKNIPPRPLLKPVLMRHKEQILKVFNKIYKMLLNGDESGADREMDILAQRVEMWTKKFFVEDNGWAPNSPATIKRKGSDKPLIDTGSRRQSIRGIFVKK